jgi:hypothetical protein
MSLERGGVIRFTFRICDVATVEAISRGLENQEVRFGEFYR